MTSRGKLFVVSAPSGAGKQSLLQKLFALDDRLTFSVSATTRPPRKGEQHGREYYFVSREQFLADVAAGAFVEWAEVHGNLYGTRRDVLEPLIASGNDVVLELDVQGLRNLQAAEYDVVSIFVAPPSMEELERRLRRRGTDDEAAIAVRLENARAEMDARDAFDYVVVNDSLDEALTQLQAIIRGQRKSTTHQQQET